MGYNAESLADRARELIRGGGDMLFREDARGGHLSYPFMRMPMVESLDVFDVAAEMVQFPGTRLVSMTGSRRARMDAMSARNDAALTAAFARQFEYVFKELYETEYPEHRAMEFVPVTTEVPPGSLIHTYRMINKIGNAKIISSSGMAQDFPNADIEGEETPLPVVTLGASYNWSVIDMQRAAMTQQGQQIPIEALKADAARYAIEFLLEQLVALGSANDGLPGLINLPGVNATTQVSTGTWATQAAAIGSANVTNNTVPALVVAQAIGSDCTACKSKIRTQTKLVHKPDTFIAPTTALIAIEENVRSPGFTDDTIKQWLERTLEMDFEGWPFLDASNTGSSGIGLCYKRDPKILQLVLAQPFTQLAPQPRSAAWQVPCMMQYGGIVIRYPLAFTTISGIA